MKALLNFLRKNNGNRGIMAALRCGLVPGKEPRAWPYLVPFGGVGDSQKAKAVRTIAGLYATHPDECAFGNLGTVCLRMCGAEETPWKDEKPGSMAKRLLYMLEADRDEIFARVIRIVVYAKAQGVSINYERLASDLCYWPSAREMWAQAFWTPAQEGKPSAEELEMDDPQTGEEDE